MKKKMENAPIYYGLAQVRFNTLASIETYIPKIQESFRLDGFPDYQPVHTAQLMIGLQVPKAATVIRYLFLNEARTTGFMLDQSFLTFQTTDYDTFEPFLNALMKGLNIVHREAKLSYYERIGIRFLDAIVPETGDDVSKYLHSSVTGLANRFDDRELIHSISEIRTILEKRVLVSRIILHKQTTQGLAFPEDLQPILLQPLERFAKVSGKYAILDTDCWVEGRNSFELTKIESTLRACHTDMDNSFDLMVTDHALKVWN